MNAVGPQVRCLRIQNKMTQDDLAAQCNLLGRNISRGTLAKIESQVRRVKDSEVALPQTERKPGHPAFIYNSHAAIIAIILLIYIHIYKFR